MASPADFSDEELATLEWMQEGSEREPTKLSLWTQRFDPEQQAWVNHPSRAVTEYLWILMDHEQRMRMWEAFGRRYQALDLLELGAEYERELTEDGCEQEMDRECFLGDDELSLLLREVLPPRLDGMRTLYLGSLSLLTDDGLKELAAVGCGTSLESLTLHSLGLDVTDEGLCALVGSGCGPRLSALDLADLKEGVTDETLEALAQGGCGENLTWLRLFELEYGVTKEGVRALAASGCGQQLTMLDLFCNSGLEHDFAWVLGLPRQPQKQAPPQRVYQQWRLRRDQFLFLRDKAPAFGGAAGAVRLWDEMHRGAVEEQLDREVFMWTPGPQGARLLRGLPLEMWQEVLGFCPFEEYATLVVAVTPPSREFYYLLKQSLLELHCGQEYPTPALGGLWLATRDSQAKYVRVLRLGGRVSTRCLKRLAEVMPLDFLRMLDAPRCALDPEELHRAVAPQLRVPHRLVVTTSRRKRGVRMPQ